MGRNDQSVAPAAVERWAARNQSVQLRWLDSDHELVDQLDTMWRETSDFFGLGPVG